jgi:hypothetical protein
MNVSEPSASTTLRHLEASPNLPIRLRFQAPAGAGARIGLWVDLAMTFKLRGRRRRSLPQLGGLRSLPTS